MNIQCFLQANSLQNKPKEYNQKTLQKAKVKILFKSGQNISSALINELSSPKVYKFKNFKLQLVE